MMSKFIKKHQTFIMNSLLILSFLQQHRWIKVGLCSLGCIVAIILLKAATPVDSKLGIVIVIIYWLYVIIGNILFVLLQ